jgi:hypothetical protein
MSPQIRRNISGTLAVLAGCAVVYVGDWLVGVDIELWWGLATFTPMWMVAVFVVPLISGIVCAMIFGLGGKWLCYFPPLIVRTINYFAYFYGAKVPPDGAELLFFPYWIMFVILVVEAAAFGGVFGEIVVKKTYGRLPREMVYRKQGDQSAGSGGQGG